MGYALGVTDTVMGFRPTVILLETSGAAAHTLPPGCVAVRVALPGLPILSIPSATVATLASEEVNVMGSPEVVLALTATGASP